MSDISQAYTLQKLYETPVIPIALTTTILIGAVLIIVKLLQLSIYKGKRPSGYDLARRMRDTEEQIRQFEGRQGETPILALTLTCFAGDKFLRNEGGIS